MDPHGTAIAVVVGVVQGVFEWLPVSSEGNLVLVLAALSFDPESAVRLALFVHAGTAVSALAYYREEFADAIGSIPYWRPRTAFSRSTATLSYVAVATAASAVVGLLAYALLQSVVSALTGGGVVVLVGLLLVVTGLVHRISDGDGPVRAERDSPGPVDAVLVGAVQGLAVLPGVSRSGVTTSALLFRGHDGPAAFRLSFLLSVPAALGAGVLAILDAGGVPAIAPATAAIAVAVSAVVGYLTIDALMRAVERVSFAGICVALGTVAVVGGAIVLAVQA